MFKTNLLSLIFICVVAVSHTKPLFAHAVVTKHSLEITPVHSGKPTSVTLDFNSKIEVGLSKIFLVRAGDIHEPIKFSNGRKPGQVVVELPALDPGEYALRFKIFAADGHLTEDIIHFIVKP